MTKYPDKDWPYTFYFNGRALPKYTAQWHLCDLGPLLNDYQDDWDEFIGYRAIRILEIWLYQIGTLQSEDPLIFRVCTQQVLSTLIRNKQQALATITKKVNSEDPPETILHGILDGACEMLKLTHDENRAFWISGYTSDCERLEELMRSVVEHELQSAKAQPPHVRQRKSELRARAQSQIKDLRRLAQIGNLDKADRARINQLPS